MLMKRTSVHLLASVLLVSAVIGSSVPVTAGPLGAPATTAQVPADFPVAVYPCSRVFSVDKMGPITIVMFTHKDDAKVLSKWYQTELPKKGWTFQPVAPQEKPTKDITLIARNGKNAVTIGLYPAYYPNGDARYTLTLQ